MLRTGRITRISALLAALAAVTVLAAACTTAMQEAGRGHRAAVQATDRRPPSSCRPAAVWLGLGPAPGSRCLAEDTLRGLLPDAVLPPVARPLGSRKVPVALRHLVDAPAVGHLLQAHAEFFAVPRSAGYVRRFLRGAIWPELYRTGSGQVGGPTGPYKVSWSLRRPPDGVYMAEIDYSVLGVDECGTRGLVRCKSFASPAPARYRSTLVRVDVEVAWYPPRSSAEYIRPARFRAARLEATGLNPRTHMSRRVLTSRPIIASLARHLNTLPADPGGTFRCPGRTVTYKLTFVPAVAGQKSVLAVPDLCPRVIMRVGGLRQPELRGGDSIIALIERLLKVSKAK